MIFSMLVTCRHLAACHPILATKDQIQHECTSLFLRSLLPEWLPEYRWQWPIRYQDEIDSGKGSKDDQNQDHEMEDPETVPDRILDLSPCYFGWPATRSRSYTVPLIERHACQKFLMFVTVSVVSWQKLFVDRVESSQGFLGLVGVWAWMKFQVEVEVA